GGTPDRELQPDRTPTWADKTPPDSARLRSRSARARRPAEFCLRLSPAPPPPAADPARSLGQVGRTWNLTPRFRRASPRQTSRASARKNQELRLEVSPPPAADRHLRAHLPHPPRRNLEIVRRVI